jgi:DNA topoisomerase-1
VAARKKTVGAKQPTTRAVRKKKTAPNGAADKAPSGSKNLVIVESPAKAKTIEKYLGPGFVVRASYGHVRDLPRRRSKGEAVAGVDIDSGWVPTYVVVEREEGPRGQTRRRSPKDILAELKREAGKVGHVYLATDPDREGEAIAWHLEEALKLDDARTFRITFNEITRTAVQNALAHPGKIDMDRVRAQEARRILDRVVGYPLSNLISRKVTAKLSAGRVQSVALRLVVDREREIEAFKPEEYWKITALLAPEGTVPFPFKPFSVIEAKKKPGEDGSADQETRRQGDKETDEKAEAATLPKVPEGAFLAELAEWAGKKFEAKDGEAATAIARLLDTASYVVSKVEQKDRSEKPQAPFTTSTLQQQASLRLRFKAEHTMRVAQRLYEGVDLGSEGSVALITYMRTDSTRVSNEALHAVRDHIGTTYGDAYLPAKPHTYASGKSAQEAHEAIRPTDVANTPSRVASLGLHGDQLKLYTLIYNRFVASQMAPALFAVTNVEVTAQCSARAARAGDTGRVKGHGRPLKFDGYRKVLAPAGKQEDALLPHLDEGKKLDRLDLVASRHFTQPPPRYNEASLVRALEKEGIGRPSTYATIIGKITSDERGYIEVKDRRFYATELGKRVTDFLVKHFPNIMDLKFTSHFEEELDEIETGKMPYVAVLNEFWGPFSDALRKAGDIPAEETGETCPQCGRPLVKKFSRKTKREFIGCSGYKEGCKYIKPAEGEEARPAPVETEYRCPACGKPMLLRQGPRGAFLGCSGYPECTATMNLDEQGNPVPGVRPTEHLCEKCGKPMVIREGRRGPFLACTGYPKCKNAKDVDAEGNPVQPVDTGVACEKCGSPMIIRRGPRGPFLGCSAYPKCRSTKPMPEELKEKAKALMPARSKKELPKVDISETCPECGGPMVLRESFRRGRSGYFLGCAKYPKCKGTREASAEILEQLQESSPA